jgi:hypothetical protein
MQVDSEEKFVFHFMPDLDKVVALVNERDPANRKHRRYTRRNLVDIFYDTEEFELLKNGISFRKRYEAHADSAFGVYSLKQHFIGTDGQTFRAAVHVGDAVFKHLGELFPSAANLSNEPPERARQIVSLFRRKWAVVFTRVEWILEESRLPVYVDVVSPSMNMDGTLVVGGISKKTARMLDVSLRARVHEEITKLFGAVSPTRSKIMWWWFLDDQKAWKIAKKFDIFTEGDTLVIPYEDRLALAICD